MGKQLWVPSEKTVKVANITKFMTRVNEKYGLVLNSYKELYNWSVVNISDFWESVWDFCGIIASRKYDTVVELSKGFIGSKWFQGAKLNFAENLLRYRDVQPAFIFNGENKKKSEVTYKELYSKVSKVSKYLLKLGVKAEDRICAYMPNLIETPVAMLAATSIGAIWASCGAELAPSAVLDRFGQIEPKVLFTADGYYYKNEKFPILSKAKEIVDGIPSIKKMIVTSYIENNLNPDSLDIPNAVLMEEIFNTKEEGDIKFEQLPFDHPLYIMFSSGTTGKPKCMVQGAGGVLINHLKELILQTDLKREDRIFYISSPSWMMWNWLMSSLAVGATIILFDGNPLYPDWKSLWRLTEELGISIFGCSANYILHLSSLGVEPGKEFDLSSIREISQTASPLSEEGYEWLYNNIKEDFHFNSISGGTDINGCFAAGSPTLPVYAGEIQALALGMKVKAYDDDMNSVEDVQGELVCEIPSPSMPLYFWNDTNNERYKDAYFNYYTDESKTVWRHGDYVRINSKTGGITFFGRSDAVLKPSGVRIGTAEIYNIVEAMPEVIDSLAVGQTHEGKLRVILFVMLAPNVTLTDELKAKIKKVLKTKASPRHVPALILEAPDIPYTFSGKKVEIAITKILHNREIKNQSAMRNPESLKYYEEIRDFHR
ncbi:MAG: acetoacetate--CoA ligase [Candidatus Hodarchaeota archaeon]